jgi:nucleotide-binding universal stress UspA family protein
MVMFTKILLCSDGSEGSLKAAQVAVEMAKVHAAELTMLHVCPVPPVNTPFPGAPSFAVPLLESYVEDLHLAVINRTMPVAREAGVRCHVLLEVGDPITVISRIADRCGFELVIMGCRGTNADRGPELGSVSQGVTQRAHCPVLIVR